MLLACMQVSSNAVYEYMIYWYAQSAGDAAEIQIEGDSKPVVTDTTDNTSAPATAADKGLIKFYLW